MAPDVVRPSIAETGSTMNAYDDLKQNLKRHQYTWLVNSVAGFICSNLPETLLNPRIWIFVPAMCATHRRISVWQKNYRGMTPAIVFWLPRGMPA